MFTLLDSVLRVLNMRNAPADHVRTLLQKGGEAVPDLKPLADALAEKLDTAVSAENRDSLVGKLTAEVDNIKKLHFEPRDHPSDA